MTDANRPSSSERVVRRLPLLIAVSAGAAFVYHFVWMRSLGLVFGDTSAALATVVAVSLGGTALGFFFAARKTIADPLRAYGLVEIGVGAAAIVSLALLRVVPWAYGALSVPAAQGGTGDIAGRWALAAMVLLPATVLLGMAVPLAVEVLAREGQSIHASFGRLYGLTMLGGAAGVVLVPFLLLPLLGARGALVAGAVASFGVGAVALRWRKAARLEAQPTQGSGEGPGAISVPERQALTESDLASSRVLSAGLALLLGAVSIGIGALWVRSYVLVLGSSVYAVSLMFLAALLGLAGGAFVYSRIGARIARPTRVVGFLFMGTAVSVLMGQWAIGGLPIAFLAALDALPASFLAQQLAVLLLCLATMSPVTVLLGLTFPLLLHLPGAGGMSAQQASGWLYGWNALGAFAGALAVTLVLVPALGLQPSFLVLAALLLAGGIWAFGQSLSWRPSVRILVPLGLVVAVLGLSPLWAPWDPVVMTSGVHRHGFEWRDRPGSISELGEWLGDQREILLYREGSESVVAVAEVEEGGRLLSVNGETVAASGGREAVAQKYIAHVPMLLHAEPRRLLVLGRGAGATAASAALHPTVESVEWVESEPAVYEAASLFPEIGGTLAGDPRFGVAFGEARNHLLRARESWDVIVSEASRPETWSVASLFTREFYEVVAARLAPGGVFAQRLDYQTLEALDIRVVMKTFLGAFPSASAWLVPPPAGTEGMGSPGSELLLVGSLEVHGLDWAHLGERLGETPVGEDMRSTGVKDPLSLLATWAMSRADMKRWMEAEETQAPKAPLNTDDRPYLELAAPRRRAKLPGDISRNAAARHAALGAGAGDALTILRRGPEPDGDDASGVAALQRDLAERYLEADQLGRALGALDAAGAALPEDAEAHARAAELLLDWGRQPAALARLREAVRRDPDHVKAWDLLGEVAVARKDYLLAESAHRAVLRREPGNVTAWLRLGAVLARQGKWSEAKEALQWAKRLDPEAPVDPELERYIDGKAAEPTLVVRP